MKNKNHPKAEADLFTQKRTQDFGKAERKIHFSGPDSIYYSDSILTDCHQEGRIYCYINRGSEMDDSHDACAYRGFQTERYLWRFANGKSVYDVAIDRRCRYAAVAAEDGVYILEAAPKHTCRYPRDGSVLRPDEWNALLGFAAHKKVELAFDENDRLHVREYSSLLCPEDEGDDYIRYILDIDNRRALDENGILSGVLEDQQQLKELALHAQSPKIRFLAMHGFDDDELMLRIYETDADERVQLGAVNRIQSQSALADIVEHAPDVDMQRMAVSRLNDMALLEKVYFDLNNIKEVRYTAWNRLKVLKGEE